MSLKYLHIEKINLLSLLHSLQMLSLRQHFFELKKELDIAKPEDTFEDDFIKLSKRVDEWNRKVADVRVAREDEKRTEEELRILEDIDCRQKKQEEERLRVNELVRLEKVSLSIHVTENIVSNSKIPFVGGGKVVYCA